MIDRINDSEVDKILDSMNELAITVDELRAYAEWKSKQAADKYYEPTMEEVLKKFPTAVGTVVDSDGTYRVLYLLSRDELSHDYCIGIVPLPEGKEYAPNPNGYQDSFQPTPALRQRIIEEALGINWELLKYDYVAFDSNGAMYNYEREPAPHHTDVWDSAGDSVCLTIDEFNQSEEGVLKNWKTLLFKRPESARKEEKKPAAADYEFYVEAGDLAIRIPFRVGTDGVIVVNDEKIAEAEIDNSDANAESIQISIPKNMLPDGATVESMEIRFTPTVAYQSVYEILARGGRIDWDGD